MNTPEQILQDKIRHQAYYQKNKERIRIRQREYEEAHKDERAFYHKQHNILNAVKVSQQHKEYRLAHKEEINKWEEENKEKIAQTQKCWRTTHKEEKAKYCHQFYLTHKEEIRIYNKQYALDHAKEIQEYTRQYHDVHPGVMKAHHERRRARMLGADGSFTAKEFETLCEAHSFACVYCGDDLPLGPDHVIPLANDGSNNIENILPACKPCNCSKGTKSFEEFVGQHTLEEQEEILTRVYIADHPEVVERLREKVTN